MKYFKAIKYMKIKHGQCKNRYGGDLYETHPAAVAEILKDMGYGIDYQLAALFHDLLEDTDAMEEEILELSNREVLKAVKLMTKAADYKMNEYLEEISNNSIAYAVKAADRLHNLLDAHKAPLCFRRDYMEETEEWYTDFGPAVFREKIKSALQELKKTLNKGE